MLGIVDELASDIRDGRALAIVGAGVSAWSTANNPLATWRGLLLDGVEHAKTFVPDATRSRWEDAVRRDIDLGEPVDFVNAGDRIVRALGENTPRFGHWLERTIGSLRVHDDRVLRALDVLGVPILTTNFDTLFSAVDRTQTITWREAARVMTAVNRRDRVVVHIRGEWRRPETVVLTHSAYAELTTATQFLDILRGLLVSNTVILVGVGAGAGDPGFEQLWPWLEQTLANTTRPIYQFCLRAEERAVAERSSVVLPVVYGESYEELATELEQLGERVQRPGLVPDDKGPSTKPPDEKDPDGAVTTPHREPEPESPPWRAWFGIASIVVTVVVVAIFATTSISAVRRDRRKTPTMSIAPPTNDPLAPRNLRIVRDNGTSAILAWEDPTQGHITFTISMQSDRDSRFTLVDEGPKKGETQFTLNDLRPDLGYCILVSSMTEKGSPGSVISLRSEKCDVIVLPSGAQRAP